MSVAKLTLSRLENLLMTACDALRDRVGSGGMFIQVRDYVREKGQDVSNVRLFGQEKMPVRMPFGQPEANRKLVTL